MKNANYYVIGTAEVIRDGQRGYVLYPAATLAEARATAKSAVLDDVSGHGHATICVALADGLLTCLTEYFHGGTAENHPRVITCDASRGEPRGYINDYIL